MTEIRITWTQDGIGMVFTGPGPFLGTVLPTGDGWWMINPANGRSREVWLPGKEAEQVAEGLRS